MGVFFISQGGFVFLNNEETQNQKVKENKREKFDKEPIKEFATDKRRQEWGHICDSCSFKWKCNKWGGAIILSCENYSQKNKVQKRGDFKGKKRF